MDALESESNGSDLVGFSLTILQISSENNPTES
jgi:hypothetical protein